MSKGERIGVVENDERFRADFEKCLGELPDVDQILTWDSAELFWRDEKSRSLDMVFLDIGLPGMDGVELAGMISSRDPETSIIMLSNLNADSLIFRALRNGAVGYLLKTEMFDVAQVVETVKAGGATITPTIAFRVLRSFHKGDEVQDPGLTPKESQILNELVRGRTVARVAEFLDVSENTVHFHVKNIYKKLKVHNRAELTRKAGELGLL